MSQVQSGHLEGDARVTEESSARGAETYGVSPALTACVTLTVSPGRQASLGLTSASDDCTERRQTLNQHPAMDETGGGLRVGVSIDRNRRCRRSMEECVARLSFAAGQDGREQER